MVGCTSSFLAIDPEEAAARFSDIAPVLANSFTLARVEAMGEDGGAAKGILNGGITAALGATLFLQMSQNECMRFETHTDNSVQLYNLDPGNRTGQRLMSALQACCTCTPTNTS